MMSGVEVEVAYAYLTGGRIGERSPRRFSFLSGDFHRFIQRAIANWKEQVREALGGHKLEVAFDAVGGKAIDALAQLVDDGGTIIHFASLESNMGTNIYSLAPHSLALKRQTKPTHDRNARRMRSGKISTLALSPAANHPELFEVADEYEFGDFQRAIQHVSRPERTGIVLPKNPA